MSAAVSQQICGGTAAMMEFFFSFEGFSEEEEEGEKEERVGVGRQAAEGQGCVSCRAEPGHGVRGQEVTWRSDWAGRKGTGL